MKELTTMKRSRQMQAAMNWMEDYALNGSDAYNCVLARFILGKLVAFEKLNNVRSVGLAAGRKRKHAVQSKTIKLP